MEWDWFLLSELVYIGVVVALGGGMVWVSFDSLGRVISRVLAFVGVADWFWFGWGLSALTTIPTANPSSLTTICIAPCPVLR